jgi:DNA transposition AAA+ family ATPase
MEKKIERYFTKEAKRNPSVLEREAAKSVQQIKEAMGNLVELGRLNAQYAVENVKKLEIKNIVQ